MFTVVAKNEARRLSRSTYFVERVGLSSSDIAMEGTAMKTSDRSSGEMCARSSSSESGYRHGNLPQVLMDLAIEHIERAGTEKLSLRALARDAGVSPTAPYRHFSSKQCLLAAIATQGFDELRKRNAIACDKSLPLEERLVAMSIAYVDFCIENPVLYQLMFGSTLADFSEYDMLHKASQAAYEEVDVTLKALIKERALEADLDHLASGAWAFVHGMSSLLASKIDLGEATRPMQALEAMRDDAEAVIRLFMRQFFAPKREPSLCEIVKEAHGKSL